MRDLRENASFFCASLGGGVFSPFPRPQTGQTWAEGFTAALGNSDARVQQPVGDRAPGKPGRHGRASAPYGRAGTRAAGAGRRAAGAGRRAAAEELPGVGALALPGGACNRQRGVAQVSGRWGRGAQGGGRPGPGSRSFLSWDTRFPAPPLPTRRPALPESRHLPVAPQRARGR